MNPGDAAARERRRQLILTHEQAAARSIAVRIVEKPALSVWMILVPLLFVHYLQRHRTFKHGVEAVSAELLRTKQRALDLACHGAPVASAAEEDNALPAAVRTAERTEIAALTEHYRRLLAGEGSDYAELVRSAYPDADGYAQALERLAQAEEGVVAAAKAQFPDKAAVSGLFDALAAARAELRAHERKSIFPARDGG